MTIAVSSGGRITVPKAVCDLLDIRPGREVRFRRATDGSIVIERADGLRPKSRLTELRGVTGPGPSTDEIMALTRGD